MIGVAQSPGSVDSVRPISTRRDDKVQREPLSGQKRILDGLPDINYGVRELQTVMTAWPIRATAEADGV